MKLSTNFTLFGLNVKAIQAYLKEQAKDRRGVRITCRGDLVYIITAYTAFKLPSGAYVLKLSIFVSKSWLSVRK